MSENLCLVVKYAYCIRRKFQRRIHRTQYLSFSIFFILHLFLDKYLHWYLKICYERSIMTIFLCQDKTQLDFFFCRHNSTSCPLFENIGHYNWKLPKQVVNFIFYYDTVQPHFVKYPIDWYHVKSTQIA